MPAKGRRVASRQAQLGRRRRRQAHSPGDIPAVATVVTEEEPADTTVKTAPPTADGTSVGSASAAPVNGSPAAAPSRAPASVRPSRSGRSPAQNRNEVPMAYTHLGSELRRILTLAGALLVILVVLTVVI